MAPTDTPSKTPAPAIEAVPAQTKTPETEPVILDETELAAAFQRLEKLKPKNRREALTAEERTEFNKILEEVKKATETTDDQAAEALLDTVEEARVAFLAKLEAFEKTIPTNEATGGAEKFGELIGVDKKELLAKNVEDAKTELSALIGDARGEGSVGEKIKEATTARDAKDFEKAQTAMDDANTAIMDKIDAIIAKEADIGALSKESQKAYTALADEAKLFMPKLQSAFDAREKNLKAMKTIQEKKPEPAVATTPAATVPPTPATPPDTEVEKETVATTPSTTVPANAPSSATASAPAAPTAAPAVAPAQEPASAPMTTPTANPAATPGAPETAPAILPPKAQEAMAQFPSLNPCLSSLDAMNSAIMKFSPGFGWFGLSETASKRTEFKEAISTKFKSLQEKVGTLWAEVQTALKTNDFSSTKAKLTEIQTVLVQFSNDVGTNPAPFDPETTTLMTALRDNAGKSNLAITPLVQSISSIQAEIYTAQQPPPTPASAPAPAPDTTTPEKTETDAEKKAREDKEKKQEKEEKLKIMVEQIDQIKKTATEAIAKKDMGAMVMVAFQALALLMSSFGEGGDIFLFGEAIGKALSDGSDVIPKTPSEFLNLVLPKEVAKDMVKMFRSLTMEQLYAFYQDPDVKPQGMSQENFDKLKAFKADHSKEFDDFFKDLFGKYKGKEYAEDPKTKENLMIVFVQDKMTAWVKGLPAELLQKWRGTQESDD